VAAAGTFRAQKEEELPFIYTVNTHPPPGHPAQVHLSLPSINMPQNVSVFALAKPG